MKSCVDERERGGLGPLHWEIAGSVFLHNCTENPRNSPGAELGGWAASFPTQSS